ncbi:CHAP domain-containing protein [Nocardioides caeni]|nr:CHAP domain-containing protein [Nocardioides caeni]
MRQPGLVARWGTSVLASALFATMLVFAAGMARTPLPVTPSATNTYLCSGYSGCSSDGYSDAGYGAVNDRMYWRMYSGHNCTNYVAYRMIKAGMSTSRPWSGGGNASEWGLHMSSITDQVPNVGAVAWWARYDNGSGSAGHVAYVEKVISSTEIIVSQDSWGGTFSWRRISKDSGRWPTGFIHFVDKTIGFKTTPTVKAEPVVGTELTVPEPSWTVKPGAVTYRWFVNGSYTGVSGLSFTPRPSDVGKPVFLRIRAARSGYTTAVHDVTPPKSVARGVMSLTGDPAVAGELLVDNTLVADSGTWTPEPAATAWRWYADGQLIERPSYKTRRLALTRDLVGKKLGLQVVTRTDGYEITRTPINPVGTVLAGKIEVATPFAVTGRPRVGETLKVTGGVTTPSDTKVAYTWLRDGVPIAGATGTSYTLTGEDAGARVSVRTDLTRTNYAPWTGEVAARARVQSTSSLRTSVRVVGARGRAVAVAVRVLAPEVDPVTGRVLVRIGGQTRTVTLVDGLARVSVPFSTPGRRNVLIRYLGSDAVTEARATDRVVIR